MTITITSPEFFVGFLLGIVASITIVLLKDL